MVAIADIKIAVRSRKTGKSADFMRSAMAECDGVNVEQLIRAALAGEDEIAQYLEGTRMQKAHRRFESQPPRLNGGATTV